MKDLTSAITKLAVVEAKTGPSINRGRSRQDYETPRDFLKAVEQHFGRLELDLAASAFNTKARRFYTIEHDSLKQSWAEALRPSLGDPGIAWLNPPFGVIGPWAEKCWKESQFGARILMLSPASVGTNWFRDFVHQKARVLFFVPADHFRRGGRSLPKGPDAFLLRLWSTWLRMLEMELTR